MSHAEVSPIYLHIYMFKSHYLKGNVGIANNISNVNDDTLLLSNRTFIKSSTACEVRVYRVSHKSKIGGQHRHLQKYQKQQKLSALNNQNHCFDCAGCGVSSLHFSIE